MAEQYMTALFRDIQYRGNREQVKGTRKLKTIYFWWGTPLLLGSHYLISILEEIEKYFDTKDLQELTIECNPYPYAETLASVQHIMQTYAHIPRVRFSFGIQSLDDETLQQSGRDCTFAGMQQFTKDLLAIKTSNALYNYDFISFGNGVQHQQRLTDLIASKQIDSYSLYTLELFAWAKRYHEIKDPLIAYQAPWDHDLPFASSQDSVLQDFDTIRSLFLAWWYGRYEISNYALPGKESLHNQVYWTMGEYIGIWLGAHGYIHGNDQTYRTESTWWWKQYVTATPEQIYKSTPSNQEDIIIESLFLGLRQQKWVVLSNYTSVLYDNRLEKVAMIVEHWLATYADNILQLTDAGMNVHHQVCTYLMKTI